MLSGVIVELELRAPDPAAPADWVDTALQQNPAYLAARSDAEVARYEIRQARAGHYPRIDLVARRSEQETQFAGSIPSDTETDSIGVELTHMTSNQQKRWIQERLERVRGTPDYSPEKKNSAYAQFVYPDPAQTLGFGLSNAVQLDFLQ